MINVRFLALILVVAGISSAFGQLRAVNSGTATAGSGKVAFMPLSELKEGMHGVAKTVFRGSEPEDFNVEILGVVPGAIGPKQDLIVGRLSGGGATAPAYLLACRGRRFM